MMLVTNSVGKLESKIALVMRELSIGLFDRRLKRPRIDLEQQLSLLDKRPFRVGLPDQISRYLRSDRGVHHAIQDADPFAVYGNVPLLYRDHLNIWRSFRFRAGSGSGAS